MFLKVCFLLLFYLPITILVIITLIIIIMIIGSIANSYSSPLLFSFSIQSLFYHQACYKMLVPSPHPSSRALVEKEEYLISFNGQKNDNKRPQVLIWRLKQALLSFLASVFSPPNHLIIILASSMSHKEYLKSTPDIRIRWGKERFE